MDLNLKNVLLILIAVVAAAMGFVAAWEWWKSSEVEPDLGYIYPGSVSTTYERNGISLPRSFEPVDNDLKRMNEIDATWDAMSRAAKMNTTAALWTAGSIGLGTLGTIISAVL